MDLQRNLLVRRHSCDKTQGMLTKTRVAKREARLPADIGKRGNEARVRREGRTQ